MSEEFVTENQFDKIPKLALVSFMLALLACAVVFIHINDSAEHQSKICNTDKDGNILYNSKTGQPDCYNLKQVVMIQQQIIQAQTQAITDNNIQIQKINYALENHKTAIQTILQQGSEE